MDDGPLLRNHVVVEVSNIYLKKKVFKCFFQTFSFKHLLNFFHVISWGNKTLNTNSLTPLKKGKSVLQKQQKCFFFKQKTFKHYYM